MKTLIPITAPKVRSSMPIDGSALPLEAASTVAAPRTGQLGSERATERPERMVQCCSSDGKLVHTMQSDDTAGAQRTRGGSEVSLVRDLSSLCQRTPRNWLIEGTTKRHPT